ncbi:hypothetical protein KP509_23G086100 [Ceratopteris richardii]|uniref:Uncharacterized protein n=1 Tax=Ceratopteris richardii TaxID=49495 RepID=A0A8T2S1T7_CERRI|nr:hypothetical protein KP509_23G086100 [Ceratopteris richardii]
MGASIVVIASIVSLDLIAFGLGLAAEQRRAAGVYVSISNEATQWCQYSSDLTTALAAGAFAALVISQLLVAFTTRCMCFGVSLKPGAARIFAFLFCILNWITFFGAEAFFLAGAVSDAKHVRYFSSTFGKEINCEAIRKDTFVAGMALTIASCILSISYYFCYSKSQDAFGKVRFNRVEDGLSMSHYP